MYIDYESSAGTVCFGGGRDSLFRITGLDGLWLTGRSFQTAAYAGLPGQRVIGVTEASRTISISGDLRMDADSSPYILSSALTALNQPGKLIFYFPDKTLEISCRLSAADQGDRDPVYQRYVFQFLCDDPYFSDIGNTRIPLYQINGMLSDTFAFPGMFSGAVIGGTVYYEGTASTEPVIRITINAMPPQYPDNGFLIVNETTGQQIGLDYIPAAGDVITIDIPSREIYLQDGSSLLPYITDGTFLNGFTLVPGENSLYVRNFNVLSDAYMECVYKNQYLEAVW